MRTVVLLLLASTAAASLSSTNGTASNGSREFPDHGDPKLACGPAKWTDVLAFFLLNYLAHVATLKSIPGESLIQNILSMVAALFFPASGVFRASNALMSLAIFGKTDLHMAARAGALCTVVEYPQDVNGKDSNAALEPANPICKLLETSIHGSFDIPAGYVLAVVPRKAQFEVQEAQAKTSIMSKIGAPFRPAEHNVPKVSSSYNAVKILVALIQLLYAIVTIYRSQGDQIDWYGYAAFGLTVIPYAWMSFINLLANLLCPDYPTMYLVGSELMDDLQTRGVASFDGVVGKLTTASHAILTDKVKKHVEETIAQRPNPLLKKAKRFSRSIFFTGLAASVPVAIIAWLSRARLGSRSTSAQLAAVALWLLYGIYFGVIGSMLLRIFEDRPMVNVRASGGKTARARLWVALTFLLGFNAVFGLVEVGKMIVSYGVCVSIG